MTEATSAGEFYRPVSRGPAIQRQLTGAEMGLAGTIAGSGSIVSDLILTDGFVNIAIGATLSQAGTLEVQRYIDNAGSIAQGAALTAALTANTPAVLNNADDHAFQSMTISIINSGTAAATVSNLIGLLQGE